jgi:biotin synthase
VRPEGVVVIAGGKLTTYRRMAKEAVDAAAKLLASMNGHGRIAASSTRRRPLPGAAGLAEPTQAAVEQLARDVERTAGVPARIATHLVQTYGTRASAVTALAGDATQLQRIDPELPYVWAEVRHAVEHELARTVEDVLVRRIPLASAARTRARRGAAGGGGAGNARLDAGGARTTARGLSTVRRRHPSLPAGVTAGRRMSMQSGLRHDWRTDDPRDPRPAAAGARLPGRVRPPRESDARRDAGVQAHQHQDGRVPEDCGYCSQSAHWQTGVEPQALMDRDVVVDIARKALQNGVSRVCMGAAWRDVRDGVQFDRVLDIVRDVSAMGVEVCCTLGMLTPDQAKRLEEAGSVRLQPQPDSSRALRQGGDDAHVRRSAPHDRRRPHDERHGLHRRHHGPRRDEGRSHRALRTLATLTPHPESVPVNILAKAPAPMEHNEDAVHRHAAHDRDGAHPHAEVGRAPVGRPREALDRRAGALLLAGANSLFSSDTRQMLTAAAPSPDYDADKAMLDLLGLHRAARRRSSRASRTSPGRPRRGAMSDGLDLDAIRNFGTALLIGALVGIEREKRKEDEHEPSIGRAADVRRDGAARRARRQPDDAAARAIAGRGRGRRAIVLAATLAGVSIRSRSGSRPRARPSSSACSAP